MPQSLWLDGILLGLQLYKFIRYKQRKTLQGAKKMYFGRQKTTTKEQSASVCRKIRPLICHGLCYYSETMWNRIQLSNLSAFSQFQTPPYCRYFREKVLLVLSSFE